MRLAVLLLIAASSLHPQELSHTTPPTIAHKVEPKYTKEALDAQIEGVVLLSLTVEADGVPSNIKVVHGLRKGLNETAVDCLRQWRFNPATNYFGEPVPQKASVEMNFRLSAPPNPK